jgi:hypothetical protein
MTTRFSSYLLGVKPSACPIRPTSNAEARGSVVNARLQSRVRQGAVFAAGG